tara:strand:+ start:471 stop:662 length:192 start_codon:yes stop_codon:yes gene_type:complete
MFIILCELGNRHLEGSSIENSDEARRLKKSGSIKNQIPKAVMFVWRKEEGLRYAKDIFGPLTA